MGLQHSCITLLPRSLLVAYNWTQFFNSRQVQLAWLFCKPYLNYLIMTERKNIAGDAQEIWHQINSDFIAGNNLHNYQVTIQHENRNIDLDIVSSPGGSAEGGYDVTTLSSELPAHANFYFAIHPEDFLNKIGKLFGMEDVVLGYPEFDNNVIVKTNNAHRLKRIFAAPEIREVFQSLSGYSFRIHKHDKKEGDYLELMVQRSLTNAAELKRVFDAFCHVLDFLGRREQA